MAAPPSCGRETKTKSNINYLARMMGIDLEHGVTEYHSPQDGIHAKYFDGSGLGGDFMRYLWDGALATHAKEECSAVYDFIVQYSDWDHDRVSTEVWMFGISRGAYIVRSVAGMINNCGIIRDIPHKAKLIEDKMIYDIYRNPHPVHHPSSPEMRDFRDKASYAVRTPVKFMGLFDTVGSRGVPRLNYDSGTGFEWPEFYDACVSTAVEKVYHAVSIHDRFWGFQPCLASRAPPSKNNDNRATTITSTSNNNLKIRQKWFPGCHYDLARQEFQFLREGASWKERLVFWLLNPLSKTVWPNHKLADLALLWILQGIEREGGGALVRKELDGRTDSDIGAAIVQTRQRILHLAGDRKHLIGTGDVYDDILSYLPGGRLLSAPIRWAKRMNETAYAVLFKGVERVIPDPGIGTDAEDAPVWNEVYDYTVPDTDGLGALGVAAIRDLAGVNEKRYPSRTFQKYRVYMQTVQRQP
ncbi:uncharacterized protein B0T15DRAFT_558718 [Chaetomium strumarium]|uniref:T6SS Phospholipase effector Tle1-like catalytic domain-containing protein n=1 Tax=Chaetomium strumarium TaxID=1170767 RepID=A0AAJ0GRI6_9PEZI|nr:hypothetical protein B0T15DRAFT_558718 [Chaetomium strumarium]